MKGWLLHEGHGCLDAMVPGREVGSMWENCSMFHGDGVR